MKKQLMICLLAIAVAAVIAVRSTEPNCGLLRGHSHEVFTLAFAPDGKTLVSGSGDFRMDADTEQLQEYGELKFWDMGLRTESSAINSDARFWAAAFSPDGRWAVTGGGVHGMRAGRIQVWDWRRKKQIAAVTQEWLVQSLAISPDGRRLATVSYGSQATLWDLPNLENPVVLDGHTDDVKSVAFSPDGWLVATGSWDGTVKLWETETARCVRTLQLDGELTAVAAVAFSPDGTRVVAGSGAVDRREANCRGAVTSWEASTGRHIVSLPHEECVTALAFLPDDHTLAAGSRDGDVKLWDFRTGQELSTLSHAGPIEAIAISPDGQLMATAGRERECAIRLWNLPQVLGDHSRVPQTATLVSGGKERL